MGGGGGSKVRARPPAAHGLENPSGSRHRALVANCKQPTHPRINSIDCSYCMCCLTRGGGRGGGAIEGRQRWDLGRLPLVWAHIEKYFSFWGPRSPSPKTHWAIAREILQQVNVWNLAYTTRRVCVVFPICVGLPGLDLTTSARCSNTPISCIAPLHTSAPKPPPSHTTCVVVQKQWNLEIFSGATGQPTNNNRGSFQGPNGSGYMGLAATMWAPMGAQVPVLSPNDHPNPSQGRQKGFEKMEF